MRALINRYALWPIVLMVCAQVWASPSHEVDELEQLGTEFAAAIRHNNMNAIIAMYDMRRTGELVAQQLYEEAQTRNQFVDGFVSSSKRDFVHNLFAFGQSVGADATFLKVLTTDEVKTPVIRVDLANGGHDFVHLFAHKDEQGDWRAYDMYVATAGKRVTQKMAENLTFMLNSQSNLLKRLLGVQEIDEELALAYRQLAKQVQRGEIQQAWNTYEALPAQAKVSRGLLDISIGISQLLSDSLYTQQLALLAKHFGDDPSTRFMLLDYHFTVADYDTAIHNIQQMQALYGEEAALNNLLANLYYLRGEKTKAIAYANKARQLEPFFIDAYWTELSVLSEVQQHQDMVLLLQTMEQNWDYDFREADFAEDDIYDSFTQSAPFLTWMKTKQAQASVD